MGKVYKTGFPKNANMKDGVSNTHTQKKKRKQRLLLNHWRLNRRETEPGDKDQSFSVWL